VHGRVGGAGVVEHVEPCGAGADRRLHHHGRSGAYSSAYVSPARVRKGVYEGTGRILIKIKSGLHHDTDCLKQKQPFFLHYLYTGPGLHSWDGPTDSDHRKCLYFLIYSFFLWHFSAMPGVNNL
jgi:hypothetical protein